MLQFFSVFCLGSIVTQKPLTKSPVDGQPVDLRDSGIWNSEELSVLRNVFRAAKSQISGLEVKLRQTQRHNTELEEKLASQTATLETKSRKLSEATKANHRFVALHSSGFLDVFASRLLIGFTVFDLWFFFLIRMGEVLPWSLLLVWIIVCVCVCVFLLCLYI